MKISCHHSRRSEQGSLLVISLIFGVICAITLGSYLTLVNREERLVDRSQNWNSALAMAEAGVDEALAQINASPSDFSVNNWGGTPGKTGTFGPVTRTLTGGSYTVSIVGGATPAIYSTGYVAVAATSQTVARKVKVIVTSEQASPFTVALGAVHNINMNGHSLITDSWNSHTNTLSTGGHYDSSKIAKNGSVASEEGILDIGNQTIQGNVYLGPDAVFQSGANGTITGTKYEDYNVSFPDVTLPTTDDDGNSISWSAAPIATGASNSSYKTNYFTADGYYTVNNSYPIYVASGVKVTLDVKSTSFNPSSITIDGGVDNSGSIVMYQESGSVTLGGNSSGGAIGNRPENFVYFGMKDVSTITFSGNSDFVGAIYAPEATLVMNGGGNSVNVSGSVIVGNATDNGHYRLHYDESLANWHTGPNRGYIPISWQEL